jgi:murein L,D-transpeptidase YafK
MLITALVFACAFAIAIAVSNNVRSAPARSQAASNPETGRGLQTDSSDPNKTPLRLPLSAPKIVVSKSKRQLALYSNDKIVRLYRIGLGFSPAGDKARQGDGRTPEGQFYVCVKNAGSRFYLSLGLSYPNKEHAGRGLREGLISRAEYNSIISALDRRARPPWDTRLGGEIFIHGHGSTSDWTLGCVALDNTDMKELFDVVPKGTAVTIEP